VEICQLQKANVRQMNEDQKFVFFVNIYHTMMMHTFVEFEMTDSILSRMNLWSRCVYNIGTDFSLVTYIV
jgi:hypothetical protein